MIVLVEDDPDQRLALKLALEQAGYTVREAADGREAFALQRERACRFLITDIFMPRTDGFEIIDAVRRDFPQTRIVVISGGGRQVRGDYLSAAAMAGADAALRKPFEFDDLLTTLQKLSA